MSWSISGTGTKDEALKLIRDQIAGAYYKPGTPEGDDIVAAGARIEALVAAMAPAEKVELIAYGSHSTTNGEILSASFSVSVKQAG